MTSFLFFWICAKEEKGVYTRKMLKTPSIRSYSVVQRSGTKRHSFSRKNIILSRSVRNLMEKPAELLKAVNNSIQDEEQKIVLDFISSMNEFITSERS